MNNHAAPLLKIPTVELNHGGGRRMPVIGLGTAADPPVAPETTRKAVVQAMELGYRHFDTAYKYGTETPIGEAILEGLNRGLITSRDDVFVTSKLWCGDAHPHLVVPALRKTLQNLKLEYLDLYLIHWPVCSRPGKYEFPVQEGDFVNLDLEGVWAAMEESQKLGLAKCIGVSNFSCKKLSRLLAHATIPPAVNQVEVNPCWQQKKLIDFCKANGIMVTAYSPLGAIGTFYGSNRIMESQVLQEIAIAKGKTIPQVCMRWAYEQGIGIVVKSFKRERMRENASFFDWQLSEEDHHKITTLIPQSRGITGWPYISSTGPIRTLEELWDGEI